MEGIEWIGKWREWKRRVKREYKMGENEMKMKRMVKIEIVICDLKIDYCEKKVSGVGREVKSKEKEVKEKVE